MAVRPPPFWKHCPQAWFLQLESMFACNQINSDLQRYNTLVSSLDSETVQDMLDVLQSPPHTGKYAYLKGRILARCGDSAQQRLHKLLTGLELGSRTPSQLFRHMRSLAGDNIDDEALRVRWLDLMPTNVSRMLHIMRNSTLDELAEVADEIVETGPAAFAVGPAVSDRRPPSPARAAAWPPTPGRAEPPSGSDARLAAELAALRAAMSQLAATTAQILETVLPLTGARGRPLQRGRSRTRGRSPAGLPSLCYYHQRFGEQATNCRPPCSHRLAREN